MLYGLILLELGIIYIGEGGIYDWVIKVYGYCWGVRVFWYYWINYLLWLVLLVVMMLELLMIIIGIKFLILMMIIVELIFIWIVVWISFYLVSDSIWILNGVVVIKMVLVVLIGGLGLYVVLMKGVVNEFILKLMLLMFDLRSLFFIFVIIFNLLGFEVICMFVDDMENFKK